MSLKVLEFTMMLNIANTKFIKQHCIGLECILFYLLTFITLLLYHRHIINIKYCCSTTNAVNVRGELVLENEIWGSLKVLESLWISVSEDSGNPEFNWIRKVWSIYAGNLSEEHVSLIVSSRRLGQLQTRLVTRRRVPVTWYKQLVAAGRQQWLLAVIIRERAAGFHSNCEAILGRLLRVDIIKWVSNVHPAVCTFVHPQNVSSISMKFGM